MRPEKLTAATFTAILILEINLTSANADGDLGKPCPKSGQIKSYSGQELVCTDQGGSLSWNTRLLETKTSTGLESSNLPVGRSWTPRPMPASMNKPQPKETYISMGFSAAINMWSVEITTAEGQINQKNWFRTEYAESLFSAKSLKEKQKIVSGICNKLWKNPLLPEARFESQKNSIEKASWRPTLGKNFWLSGCSKFLMAQSVEP